MGSARLIPLPFSIRKEGKGVARGMKAPTKVQSTNHLNTTRLLPSPLQDASLGGSCQLLRFYTSFCASWWFLVLVATSQPQVTAALIPHSPLNQDSFAACARLTSQTILLHGLDASRPFPGFSAHFLPKPHTRCTDSALAPRQLEHLM